MRANWEQIGSKVSQGAPYKWDEILWAVSKFGSVRFPRIDPTRSNRLDSNRSHSGRRLWGQSMQSLRAPSVAATATTNLLLNNNKQTIMQTIEWFELRTQPTNDVRLRAIVVRLYGTIFSRTCRDNNKRAIECK